ALVSHYVSPFPVVRNIFPPRGFYFNRNLAYFSRSVNCRFQKIVSIIRLSSSSVSKIFREEY
ncbi:MAG: hypothetical protein ACYC5X_18920, partial [Syntrophales bacterium]